MSTDKTICFSTLAIHEPYRRRARLLCADAPTVPWIVLTDEPDDFADLNVCAIRHQPTGPMAVDYIRSLPKTGRGKGAAAYHDKRFALIAALQDHDTAIYVDADSRIFNLPLLDTFLPGVAALPLVRNSVAEHLNIWGTWRRPVFADLARHLTGNAVVLQSARWCEESLLAITKDRREAAFFEAWAIGADFLQRRDVYSGEGGVIGLAAAYAGWAVDYEALKNLAACIQHEGGGPKQR